MAIVLPVATLALAFAGGWGIVMLLAGPSSFSRRPHTCVTVRGAQNCDAGAML
jgi:hypothetical protein